MSSDCGKFNCSRSATHRLVIAASNGDVVHKPRCEACGKADQRMLAKLNYLVPPGATVSLEEAGAQEDAVGDLTRAELLAKLRVEHDQAEAERMRRLDDAVVMGEAAEAIAWEQRDVVEAEQQRAETFMQERDKARAALRKVEELLRSIPAIPGTLPPQLAKAELVIREARP